MSSTIGKLLGGRQSPFRGVQLHNRAVIASAVAVGPLVDALCAGDFDALTVHAREVIERESEADKLKHDLRAHLPRSLFMPIDRRDLLEILDVQDSIADTAEDIAEVFVRRRMVPPDDMKEPLKALTSASLATVLKCAEAIERLDELLAVGFGGREVQQVEEILAEVNRLEDVADDREAELDDLLFAHEADMPAVSVMFWYRVLEWLGDLADHSEKVANRLRLLIAK